MDTQTQIDRLIELAIIQRTELKQLVEQLPQLREHLNAEVERTFEEAEPQIRTELEEFVTRQASDKTATLGVALEAKIGELAKSLEESAQAKYSALIATRDQNATLLAQAEERIAAAAGELPAKVKDIVAAELARFPRAGEIDQLRKEFAEPKSLNPRGKWQADQTYNKLDLVTINGDSYTSNIDGNRTRPSRSSADWTLVAARGTGGGGGPTSLSELTTVPSNGDILIGSGTSWVTSNLTAGAGISITVGAGEITISATDGDITLDDGTAASPSLHFTNDADTGLYRPAENTLGISVSGTQVAYFDTDGLTIPSAGVVAGGSFHGANGNANNPTFSFESDQDTGMYRHGTNELGFTVGGTEKAVLTSTTFTVTPNLVVSGTGSINGTSIPASKTLVVTTDKLSALASTSSSELAGVISDETGTGALVFANTPTLVTPNIGAATGTSATLTGNVTASDLILGSSGPSAKSSINARAARQGLVFDGTAGATVASVPAFGTGDFTVAAWVNPTSLSNNNTIFASGVATAGPIFRILTSGAVSLINGNSTQALSSSGVISAGKSAFVVYSRTGGTGSFYINGIASGSGPDSYNFSSSITEVGALAAIYEIFRGYVSGLIYNRALSAAEVVSLFEAGVPAAADYNNAGQEIITPAANRDFSSDTGFWTKSGTASITGGKAVLAAAGDYFVKNNFLTIGKRYKVTATISGYTGGIIWFSDGNGGGINATANGTYTAVFTATNVNLYMGGPSAVASFDDVSLTTAGLLLAPDAGQAGNGYIWNDQSGNLAQIVLPSSGVAWNLPSIIGNRIRGTTSTNGNQQLLGASVLLPAECQITHVRARARSGTPTITIGTASGGAQIVASVALSTTWLNCTIALTGGIVSSADDIWVGSNSTDVVETDIAFQPLDF